MRVTSGGPRGVRTRINVPARPVLLDAALLKDKMEAGAALAREAGAGESESGKVVLVPWDGVEHPKEALEKADLQGQVGGLVRGMAGGAVVGVRMAALGWWGALFGGVEHNRRHCMFGNRGSFTHRSDHIEIPVLRTLHVLRTNMMTMRLPAFPIRRLPILVPFLAFGRCRHVLRLPSPFSSPLRPARTPTLTSCLCISPLSLLTPPSLLLVPRCPCCCWPFSGRRC